MLQLSQKGTLCNEVPRASEAKKLVSVSAISTPVTKTREKATEVGKGGVESENDYPSLARVLCIRYPITFRKKSVSMSALLDSGSEVNAIHPTLAQKLGLPVRPTNVGAQKIDGTMLDTFGMVVTAFSVTDKANRVRFFEETFLVANVSPEVVLGMPFLTLSNADVDFSSQDLR